jgi:hypothetical protein
MPKWDKIFGGEMRICRSTTIAASIAFQAPTQSQEHIARIASHTLRHLTRILQIPYLPTQLSPTLSAPSSHASVHHTKAYPIGVMDIESPLFTDGPCNSLGTSSCAG